MNADTITAPAIVDVPTGQVVTNDYPQITLDLSTEWTDYHRAGAPDLYQQHLRAEINEVMQTVFRDVNNGVYRCGFAGTQEAYAAAYHRLFDRLDWLSERLSECRYLQGDTITEADVRLFITLVRFDAVYHGHFKCDQSKLTEMPCCGPTPGTCSRRPDSATSSTSTTSSGTTTRCTRTSTRPASCRSAQTCPDGPARTTANSSAGDHSATAPHHLRPVTTRRCPLDTPLAPHPGSPHLDQTLIEASDELSGNYGASITDNEAVHLHILAMAHTLGTGIIDRFPQDLN